MVLAGMLSPRVMLALKREVCEPDSELMSVGLQVCGGEGGVGLL